MLPIRVALPISRVLCVLSAVQFDDDALLATQEIDLVAAYGSLPEELETAKLARAYAPPEREFS